MQDIPNDEADLSAVITEIELSNLILDHQDGCIVCPVGRGQHNAIGV